MNIKCLLIQIQLSKIENGLNWFRFRYKKSQFSSHE